VKEVFTHHCPSCGQEGRCSRPSRTADWTCEMCLHILDGDVGAKFEEDHAMMTEAERERALTKACDDLAQHVHSKRFAELDSAERIQLAGDVYQRHPELMSSYPPSVFTTPAPAASQLPAKMAERERSVAERFGFTSADLSEVGRKEMVRNIAATEQRNADRDAIATTFAEVGKEFSLDPEVYADRLRIGEILARRNHPIARQRYGSR